METIKFVHYTDVHIQDTNPKSRVGNYLQDILDKMSHIAEIARDNDVDFTICGGDLFNKKTPGHNSHKMVNSVIKVLGDTEVDNYIITGNHDIRYDREDTLDEQPLGVLLNSGVMHSMRDEVFKKGSLKVSYKAYDFEEEPDFSKMVVEERSSADVHILGLHIYATPKGGDMFGTKLHSYEEISNTGHDIYTFGHYHKDQGIDTLTDRGYEQKYVNVGSVSRGDYGDENVNRKPKCCLVTISKDIDGKLSIDCEEIEIRCKDSKKVFDLEEKKRVTEQEEVAAEFAAELEKASKEEDGGERSINESIENLNIDKEVRQRTKEYLDAAHDLKAGN